MSDEYITQISAPIVYDPRSDELGILRHAGLRDSYSHTDGRILGYALPAGWSIVNETDTYTAYVDALSALFPAGNVCICHMFPNTVWVYTWDLSRLAHLKGIHRYGTWYRRFPLGEAPDEVLSHGWTWVRHVTTSKHIWAIEMATSRLREKIMSYR